MPTRVCIFVDGENLRHSLHKLFTPAEFDKREYLPKHARWRDFFLHLTAEACDYNAECFRAYWYVVGNIDFFPYQLNKPAAELARLLSKSETLAERLKAAMRPDAEVALVVQELERHRDEMKKRFEGWGKLQDGIQLNHHFVEFRRAGAITYDLLKHSFGSEKAVDVKLATDLVMLREIYDVAVIVSGDQDYVPAVQCVKDSGKHVVNVSFRSRANKQLPGGAWRLNVATDRGVDVSYEQVKSYLLGGAQQRTPSP